MKDKTQLEQLKEILTFVWEKGVVMDITDNEEIAQQILDLCQPKWVAVPEILADVELCRVIICECEQEHFYRCIDNKWERQTDNGLWLMSAFIPNYYFIMPQPPGESE